MPTINVMQEHPKTIADGQLGALINEVHLHKAQYSFPPALIFVHWSRGPAAICHNITANALTLLYINYIKNICKAIDEVIARPKDNQQALVDLLDGEMSRLELLCHAQWVKQQTMTPDPWGLRTCNGVPSYNTG